MNRFMYGPISRNGFCKTAHWIGGLLSLFIIFGISGCAEDIATEELIVGIEAEPERFDPLTMRNPNTFIVAWQIYEGLFGLNDDERIAPALAESWESSDSVTWRIKLREDVLFHESEIFNTPSRTRSVTAGDVVASYTAFCSSKAYAAFLLTDSIVGCADYNTGESQSVEGIRQVDETTIEFRLINPEPFFLNRLTTPWIAIFPEELMDPQYEDQARVGPGGRNGTVPDVISYQQRNCTGKKFGILGQKRVRRYIPFGISRHHQ